jgi:hypothetical protein
VCGRTQVPFSTLVAPTVRMRRHTATRALDGELGNWARNSNQVARVWSGSISRGSAQLRAGDLGLSDATFACPDLGKFGRLGDLGLVVAGRRQLLRRLPRSSRPGYCSSAVRERCRSARCREVSPIFVHNRVLTPSRWSR